MAQTLLSACCPHPLQASCLGSFPLPHPSPRPFCPLEGILREVLWPASRSTFPTGVVHRSKTQTSSTIVRRPCCRSHMAQKPCSRRRSEILLSRCLPHVPVCRCRSRCGMPQNRHRLSVPRSLRWQRRESPSGIVPLSVYVLHKTGSRFCQRFFLQFLLQPGRYIFSRPWKC